MTAGIEVGAVLRGRYEVQAPISAGAMGAVYAALDRESDTKVAIKRLLDMTQLARFEIEARLLSQLDHPRVVHVVDHFEEGGHYFFVMDLIRGQSLADVMTRRGTPGLPVAEVMKWAGETCEALDYVHSQGIVHRDVKPANLIHCDEGIVVVDFGVARELGADEAGTVAVGTPRFMAPEVFSGGTVSERSDVFSLSVTLVTLVAGGPPSYTDRAPLVGRYPGVTPEIDAAIRGGMEFMPERRIASVEAFADALGRPLTRRVGQSLVTSLERPAAPRSLIEAVVRTVAGVFDAAAASIAMVDEGTGEVVYQAAWGAGAREIVGVRLQPNQGITGAVVATGEPIVVSECRTDPRFAAQIAAGTGYVPNTMLVVPLRREGKTIGALAILDRRDGLAYGPADVTKAQLFGELSVAALGAP